MRPSACRQRAHRVGGACAQACGAAVQGAGTRVIPVVPVSARVWRCAALERARSAPKDVGPSVAWSGHTGAVTTGPTSRLALVAPLRGVITTGIPAWSATITSSRTWFRSGRGSRLSPRVRCRTGVSGAPPLLSRPSTWNLTSTEDSRVEGHRPTFLWTLKITLRYSRRPRFTRGTTQHALTLLCSPHRTTVIHLYNFRFEALG